jgi:hypothetical protein
MRTLLLVAALLLAGILPAPAQVGQGPDLHVVYLERPPYYFTDNGQPKGFLLVLTQRILDRAGVTGTWAPHPPNRIMEECAPTACHCAPSGGSGRPNGKPSPTSVCHLPRPAHGPAVNRRTRRSVSAATGRCGRSFPTRPCHGPGWPPFPTGKPSTAATRHPRPQPDRSRPTQKVLPRSSSRTCQLHARGLRRGPLAAAVGRGWTATFHSLSMTTFRREHCAY